MTTSIGDFALLSDGQTAVLVNREGSVDWYCPPHFDAPSVFARLLDKNGGHWSIQPVHTEQIQRIYLEDTMVLQTVFTTLGGKVALTDALALETGAHGHQLGKRSPHVLLRQIQGLEGEVPMQVIFYPRPEYALGHPLLAQKDNQITAQAGSLELVLLTPCPLRIEAGIATATFTVKVGESFDFALIYREYKGDNAPVPTMNVRAELENTQQGWRSWAALHQSYQGLYAQQVRRSALVLQALTFQPKGAVIAAATTALPEEIGGDKNWDYRFVWLRDFTLTMRALWIATCPDEAQAFFAWVNRALGDLSIASQPVQIVYSIEGQRDLTEHTLNHLDGFCNSRPVRIGNDAWFQKQLDVLGEVVDAIYLFRDKLGDFDDGLKQLVVQLANRAARSWQEPDAGMWEARDKERHYLTSKVMCWVAVDRAIKLAPYLGGGIDLVEWTKARDVIHQTVLEQGWNEQVQAFTGAFGSDHLDASVLLLPLVEFLPATDPKMVATIRTIERELTTHGQVYRWQGEKNGFLLCTFWLVECLALLGEIERAQQLFEQTTAYANDIGLLAEMVNTESGELIGNFPQVFSHIGLINAAWRLSEVSNQAKETERNNEQGD